VLLAKNSRTDMQTKPAIALEFRFREELVECAAARSLPNFKPDATGFLGFTRHARAMRLASFRAAP
jgi:hypothetical protein